MQAPGIGRPNEDQRRRIFELANDLFCVAGFDGRLKVINPAWTRLLGHMEEALLARPIEEFVHPDDRETAREAVRALRRGEAMPRFESRLARADGGWVWVAWTGAPQPDCFYAVGRDVSEEKRREQELVAANARLAAEIAEREHMQDTLAQLQRLEAIGQLTSGVAHDFNNLLTVVLGNIAFLEKTLEPGSREATRLAYMRTAAERGASLTAQLLAFARRQHLTPRAVDLNTVVAGMRALMQSSLGGSVTVAVKLGRNLWRAMTDATQLELVILNLAINARDAMEAGGVLTVTTGNVHLAEPAGPQAPPPGDYVMVAVSDTGAGMTPDVLAKAFEPFFTTKEVGRGSGLGLPQVAGFAAQSGGGLEIETAPGAGTTVRVYLPRSRVRETAEPVRPLASPCEDEGHGRWLLVVDDDPAVREVTGAMLRGLGFGVIEADCGVAGLERLEAHPEVDLALLDFAMPGMNGAETARRIWRQRPELPVLFITGYADAAALADLGPTRIVQKPFQEQDLAAQVRQALDAAALARQPSLF